MAEMLGGSGEGLNKLEEKLKKKMPKEEKDVAVVLFRDAVSSLIKNNQRSVIQVLIDFKGLLKPKKLTSGNVFDSAQEEELKPMLEKGMGNLFKAFEAKLNLLLPDQKSVDRIVKGKDKDKDTDKGKGNGKDTDKDKDTDKGKGNGKDTDKDKDKDKKGEISQAIELCSQVS